MSESSFESLAFGDDLDFMVSLSRSCLTKLDSACDASTLFDSAGRCEQQGDTCRCELAAEPANIHWKTTDFDVEASRISVRLGSLESAEYTFAMDGDLLVHDSNDRQREDWILIARRSE